MSFLAESVERARGTVPLEQEEEEKDVQNVQSILELNEDERPDFQNKWTYAALAVKYYGDLHKKQIEHLWKQAQLLQLSIRQGLRNLQENHIEPEGTQSRRRPIQHIQVTDPMELFDPNSISDNIGQRNLNDERRMIEKEEISFLESTTNIQSKIDPFFKKTSALFDEATAQGTLLNNLYVNSNVIVSMDSDLSRLGVPTNIAPQNLYSSSLRNYSSELRKVLHPQESMSWELDDFIDYLGQEKILKRLTSENFQQRLHHQISERSASYRFDPVIDQEEPPMEDNTIFDMPDNATIEFDISPFSFHDDAHQTQYQEQIQTQVQENKRKIKEKVKKEKKKQSARGTNPAKALEFIQDCDEGRLKRLENFLKDKSKSEFFTPLDVCSDPKYNIMKCYQNVHSEIAYLERQSQFFNYPQFKQMDDNITQLVQKIQNLQSNSPLESVEVDDPSIGMQINDHRMPGDDEEDKFDPHSFDNNNNYEDHQHISSPNQNNQESPQYETLIPENPEEDSDHEYKDLFKNDFTPKDQINNDKNNYVASFQDLDISKVAPLAGQYARPISFKHNYRKHILNVKKIKQVMQHYTEGVKNNSFLDIYAKTNNLMIDEDQNQVSLQTSFVCMLHIANEIGAELKEIVFENNVEDIRIVQPQDNPGIEEIQNIDQQQISFLGCFEFVSQKDNKAQTQTKFYEKASDGIIQIISPQEHTVKQSIILEKQEKQQQVIEEAVSSVKEVQFSENLRESIAIATNAKQSLNQSIIGDNNQISEDIEQFKQGKDVDNESDGVSQGINLEWPQFIPETVVDEILIKEQIQKNRQQILDDGRFENQYDKSTHKNDNVKVKQELKTDESIAKFKDLTKDERNASNLELIQNRQDEGKDEVDQREILKQTNNFIIETTIHTLNQQEMQDVENDEYDDTDAQQYDQVESSDSGTTINSDSNYVNEIVKKKQREIKLAEIRKPVQRISNNKDRVSLPPQLKASKQLELDRYDANKMSQSGQQQLYNFNNNNRSVRSTQNNTIKLKSQSSRSIIDQCSNQSKSLLSTQEQKTKQKIHAMIEKRKRKLIAESSIQKRQDSSPLNSTTLSNYPSKLSTNNNNTQLSQKTAGEDQSQMHTSFYTMYKHHQKNNVKQIQISDYYKGNPTDNTIRAKTFKDLMLQTLTQRSQFRADNQTNQVNNKLLFLDQILERSKGQDVYKRGEGLQKGLIDIEKVYQIIVEKNNQQTSELMNSKDKWKTVMKYMEQNPNILVDTLPVTTKETYEELIREKMKINSQRQKNAEMVAPSKKRQRLHQDLEVSKQIIYDTATNGSVQFHYQQIVSRDLLNRSNTNLSHDDGRSQSSIGKGTKSIKNITPTRNQDSKKSDNSLSPKFYQNRPDSKCQTRYIKDQTLLNSNRKNTISNRNSSLQQTRKGQIGSQQNSYMSNCGQQTSARGKSLKTQQSQRNNKISYNTQQQQQQFRPKVPDWKQSVLMKYIHNFELSQQTYESDPMCFTNEDLDYTLTMIKNNPKEFDRQQTIATLFSKSLNTIHKLCEELKIEQLEGKIIAHYYNRDLKTLMKLMIRCKELFVVKVRMIKILKMIEERDFSLESLRRMVNQLDNLDEGQLKQSNSYQTQYLTKMSKTITETTDALVKLILTFVADYHKYFGKVFIYDGTEYLEVARRESREIAEVVDIIKAEDN